MTQDTTLAHLHEIAAGGITYNDRGNGAGGPLYLGEEVEEIDYSVSVTRVTEEEDPDAWRLAREAILAMGCHGDPELVAVGEPGAGSNPHQAIYAG